MDVEGEATPSLRRAGVASMSGIEGLPPVAGEIGLDPGVGVFGADDVVTGKVVEFVAAESVDHAGRYSKSAQHDCHGGGEILAVTLIPFKQEIADRIFDCDFLQ